MLRTRILQALGIVALLSVVRIAGGALRNSSIPLRAALVGLVALGAGAVGGAVVYQATESIQSEEAGGKQR